MYKYVYIQGIKGLNNGGRYSPFLTEGEYQIKKRARIIDGNIERTLDIAETSYILIEEALKNKEEKGLFDDADGTRYNWLFYDSSESKLESHFKNLNILNTTLPYDIIIDIVEWNPTKGRYQASSTSKLVPAGTNLCWEECGFNEPALSVLYPCGWEFRLSLLDGDRIKIDEEINSIFDRPGEPCSLERQQEQSKKIRSLVDKYGIIKIRLLGWDHLLERYQISMIVG